MIAVIFRNMPNALYVDAVTLQLRGLSAPDLSNYIEKDSDLDMKGRSIMDLGAPKNERMQFRGFSFKRSLII